MTTPSRSRLVSGLFLAVAFLLTSSGLLQAQDAMSRIMNDQELVVGAKSDYGPWGQYDQNGDLIGLEPDLARYIADQLGVNLRLVAVTSANRLSKLEDGSIDLVIATMGDTIERREVADLLQPHYYASGVRLLLPNSSSLSAWSQVRGRPVCVNKGAYYNRHLAETLLLNTQVYGGSRDASQALLDGFCVGWAFDDTILSQKLKEPGWEDYRLAMDSIEPTPWTIAVRRGEGSQPLGVFVSDTIASLHRTGGLLELQNKWIGVRSPFLEDMNERWSEEGADGLICKRGADEKFPAGCLTDAVAKSGGASFNLPGWAMKLKEKTGIDAEPFLDPYNQSRLLRGLLATVTLSVVCIFGALIVGSLVSVGVVSLADGNQFSRWAGSFLKGIVSIAQLTPPILQLYILFFGVAAILHAELDVSPSAFWIAAFVFSFYAGATNAILLQEELSALVQSHPERSITSMLPTAALNAYDGLVATCINIVKAAGMASTIAFFDMITAINEMIAEGGDKFTLMNFLLLFYLLFVIVVTAAFNIFRGRLMS